MIERLLARLAARVILVGGKGGVGKTTTAGAIALALADHGDSVHLVSIDPAHSLHDLFSGETCSERLVLEEFDARAYADSWFRLIRPDLVTLIERGTYLDESDARNFLELSIPGIDEVMAALRLVDVLRLPVDRVVVDTAPTGHTLRFLDSATILRTWITTGRALADKAGAVASQLLRQPVRFPAEDTLDDIERTAVVFERDVLQAGAFVVVTRSSPLVAAETARLQVELRTRGIPMVATITDRPEASPQTLVAPQLAVTTGCAALREWADRLGTPPTDTAVTAETAPRDGGRFASELGVRLIWVAGKGGVGKSTCAAALAAFLAQSRRVCIVSTDPAGSLSELFHTAITRNGTQITPRLTARQIDALAEFAEMRQRYHDTVESIFASLGLDQAARLDRRVIEAMFDLAPPGIDEIVALIDILEQVDNYDVTIVDSAPTGHFLRLLEMPDIALEWVHALLRLLLKYHAVASLDALGQDLLAFSKRLRQLKTDLATPSTSAVFVVTLAEPLVVAETRRLCDRLLAAGIPIAAVVANRAAADAARALHTSFPAQLLMRAPYNQAVADLPGLQRFLMTWEILGG